MNRDHCYDLAYEFRNSKIWKHIYEDELFAVKLPPDSDGNTNIGYCYIMGKRGEHRGVFIHIGAKGFSSYRYLIYSLMNYETTGITDSMTELMIQEGIQCSLEKRDQFSPEELDEVKSYCKKTGRQCRAPLPQFSRLSPYCVPWVVREESEWKVLETVLQVVIKLSETVKKYGKDALDLRPVAVGLNREEYTSQRWEFFRTFLFEEEVTIPLYSVAEGELQIERITLPPYIERKKLPPTHINEIATAKIAKTRKRGVYECEIIRSPDPVAGDPPYFPAILITVNNEGDVLRPALGKGAEYDSDVLLNEFISILKDRCPRTIKVRTEETRILLTDFCKKAGIRLTVTKKTQHLDEAISSLMSVRALADGEENFEQGSIHDVITMLNEMTVEQIRMLPDLILEQMLDAAELLPENVVKKIQKAREL